MSCIRFNTKAQREAMRDDAAALAAADRALVFRSPEMTAGKVERLRVLAGNPRPGIRQSAASSRHAPADLLESLAVDRDAAVRAEVARNATTSPALLERLVADRDARVRCWAVLNLALPADALRAAADDRDAEVRRLAGWRLAPQPA